MLVTTDYTHLWILVASFVLALLVIAAIVITVRSKAIGAPVKVVWIVVLVCVPVLGIVIWAVALSVRAQAVKRQMGQGSHAQP